MQTSLLLVVILKSLTELSAMFIEHPQRHAHASSGLAAAFATHPPIEARIEALKDM